MEQTEIVNTEKPSVKILIAYHKPSVLIKDEVLTPIHLGRALATESSKDGDMSEEDYKWMLENMIGDNTGENISHLNRTLNELTSMYWAWKNYDKLGNPDYIGFMHYRRHLNFNTEKKYKENEWGLIDNDYIDENYINDYHLKADDIKEVACKYDILVADKWNVNNAKSKNNYEHYKRNHQIEYYDNALQLLEEKYPEYKEDIQNYNSSKYGYYTNVFIMKKEIFFNYSKWLFDIILQLQERYISYKNYKEARALAIASEWLFGIYLFNLRRTSNYKIAQLQRTFVHNLDIAIDFYPKFENGVSICFASDNNYAPYLAVTIKSLIENADKNKNYEIYILEDNIELEAKNKILSMSDNRIFIKFININIYINKKLKDKLFVDRHLSISTYYRFLIPRIFKYFEKILWLDSDLIIFENISEIYDIELGSYMIGACKDSEIFRRIEYEDGAKIKNGWIDYFKYTIPLDNPKNYFQAGILLFNIKIMLENDLESEFIRCINRFENPKNHDQDILNYICQNKVKYFDMSWNVLWAIPFYFNPLDVFPKDYAKEYINSYNNPKIMHYCGETKPWINPNYPKSNLWWKYAKMTDFYEEIIYINTQKITNNNINNISNINSINRFSIADFILSFIDSEKEFSITILGIRIRIRKEFLSGNNTYYNKKDKIFSIYQNNEYKRITIFGIKITIKRKYKK